MRNSLRRSVILDAAKRTNGMRQRLQSFLLFVAFFLIVQIVGGGLEWLLVRGLHIIDSAGRPWRPEFFYVWEGTGLVGVAAATWALARIGPRSVSQLGYRTENWIRQLVFGAILGFVTVAILVAAIFAFGGYRPGGLLMDGPRIAMYSAAWLLAMVLTALDGEMVLHGAGLLTLADSFGFWPAAIVLSLLVSALSLGSGGNGLNFGAAVSALLISLFLCFTVRRTGAVWFACGFHALLDYTSLFIFGSPSRGNQGGQPIGTRLLAGSLGGPRWLTGGQVGIQSSWLLAPILMVVFAVYVSGFLGRGRRREKLPTVEA